MGKPTDDPKLVEDAFERFLATPDSGGGYHRHVAQLRTELYGLRLELARATKSKPRSTPQTHLIIGDSHSDPDVPNDRYRWLGRLIADLKPNSVIDIGDWADMASLSHYDFGKRSFEGRRYKKDIEHAVLARETVAKELAKMKVKPDLYALEGNHEYRVTKATDNDPKLTGLISTADFQVERFGWRAVPFMVPVFIDGIAYSHYHPSGVKTQPIGGINLASSLVRLGLMSCVQGHSHVFDYSERTRRDGQKLLGLSVGCYFKHYMGWAGEANAMYWRGIVVLHDVVDGYGQVEKLSLDWIEKNYGG